MGASQRVRVTRLDAVPILVIPPLARDGIAIGIALSYVFREHAQT
jgi:hypothetical protein